VIHIDIFMQGLIHTA